MAVRFTNNASATLSSSITNSATSISVTAGQGALFPALSGTDFFYATLVDSSGNIEIVKVTARTSDAMTVVRGQDNTTARAYSAGDKFELRPTAAALNWKVDQDFTGTMTGAITWSATQTFSGAITGAGLTNYFASPPAIGGTSPAAGSFTNLSASGTLSGAGFTAYFASPPAIGGTAPAAGSFTNLSASGTLSGAAFTNYFASPPAIGGTTPAAGTFTTVTVTSAVLTGGTVAGNTLGYLEVPLVGGAAKTVSYTTVLADSGKQIQFNAASLTATIPANGSVAYPVGTALTFVNLNASNLTIAITTDTMTLAGSTTTGSRTLAQNGIATAVKVSSTVWLISGAGLT